MYKTITITLLASCMSFAYGSNTDNLQPFSSATQVEALTQWSSSTKTTLGSGLWSGKGFSFNLKQSEWLEAPVSTPNADTPFANKVFLNSITVKTRSSGQSAVASCYAYLCSISGSSMTVVNKSDIFNVPSTVNSSFTFTFAKPSIIDSNTTYAIVYSQSESFAPNSAITLNDAISVGMARTNTVNGASSAGRLFSGTTTTPTENYAPYVTMSTSQIPEPSAAILMLLGGLGFSSRRRRI